jgi:hypothetical protein
MRSHFTGGLDEDLDTRRHRQQEGEEMKAKKIRISHGGGWNPNGPRLHDPTLEEGHLCQEKFDSVRCRREINHKGRHFSTFAGLGGDYSIHWKRKP